MQQTLLCVPIIGPSFEAAKKQIQKASLKADILELRVDLFSFRNFQDLELEKPIILKVKDEFFSEFACLKPAFIDVEHDVSDQFFTKIKTTFPTSKIISSYHNYEGTDKDLDVVLKSMRQESDIFKICTKANTTLDSLKMLIFLKNNSKVNIAGLCMGEMGEASRILAPIFGSKIVYASLNDDLQSAQGQIPIDIMLERYRFKGLTGKTKIFGLIGDPVTQSPSHITHNRVIKELGLNAIYLKMRVSQHEVPEFLHRAKELGISGLSVTMPLKETVVKGQVFNTLLIDSETISGLNTDSKGALDAIEKRELVKDKKVLIIGAGGSAKAIAFEAKKRGATLYIVNRTIEKATLLADSLGGKAFVLNDTQIDYDILVNCTPHGALTHLLKPRTLVMDITVSKEETDLLKEARKLECKTIHGFEMLRNQAALQFHAWFGVYPPQSKTLSFDPTQNSKFLTEEGINGIDNAFENAFKDLLC